MFFQKNFVREAVAKVGGPTFASNHLGVSNGCIHKWIAAARVPNINKARQLAQLSGLELEKLRST